jgi:hypothetical protein
MYTQMPIGLLFWNFKRSVWAILCFFAMSLVGACGQQNWTQSYPGRPMGTFNAVIWDGTKFIASGEYGDVFHSVTGTAWVRYSTGQLTTLSGLAKSGTTYVATGSNGLVLTSPDAMTWTVRTTGVTNALVAVAWTGSQFVAVGTGGRVIRSADGVAWTAHATGTGTLQSILFAGGQHVVTNASGQIYTSNDAITWTLRTSGTSISLVAVAHNGSRYVALGAGAITTSLDGITWAVVSGAPNVGQTDVIWTGSEFLAIGTYARTMTSPDGLVWTSKPIRDDWVFSTLQAVTVSPTAVMAVGIDGIVYTKSGTAPWIKASSARQPDLDAVAATASLRVAVGEAGAIVTSSDDLVWTKQVSGTSVRLRDVTRFGLQWIAVGDGGTILTSPDGVAWTAQASGTTAHLFGTTASGAVAIAVGTGGTLLTSINGIVWTPVVSGTANNLRCAGYSGTDFIVGGNSIVLRSVDGTAWSTVWSGNSVWNAVTWAGTRWYVVGDGAEAINSANGTSWSANSAFFTQDLYGLAWTGSLMFVAGLDELWGTPNFSSWSLYAMPRLRYVLGGTATGSNHYFAGEDGMVFSWSLARRTPDRSSWNHIQWDGSELIATGADSRVGRTSSALGTGWTTHAVPGIRSLNASASGAGLRVAVGENGVIYTSPNGVNWALPASATTVNLTAIARSPSRFVAVGASGVIVTSMDGAVWASQTSGVTTALNTIHWTGSQFVAAGASGRVLTSVDGLAWHPRYTGSSANLRCIGSSPSTLVITGDGGVILTSTSGIVWRLETSGSTNSLASLIWAGDRFVAVGGTSTSGALTSYDGAGWASAASLGLALNSITWTGSRLVAVNGIGEILTSVPAALPTSPVFTRQPENDVIISGGTAFLQTATLGEGVTYQWYRGTVPDTTNPIGGATGASFTSTTLTATTSYWVRATNGSGLVNSRNATITVGTAYDVWAFDFGLGAAINGPTADPDADGNTNMTEFTDGTDPYLASSLLARITLNVLGTGTVSINPDQATYSLGQTVALTPTPTAPNLFYGWGGDATSSANPLLITLDKSKTISVFFGPPLGDAAESPHLSWTSGGNALWFPQITTTSDGMDALQSGPITHSQETWVETTVTGPGLLAFRWSASTQPTSDKLDFLLDGVIQTTNSGITAFTTSTHTLTAGSHILRWRYSKNATITSNSDAVWIDQVTYTPFQSFAQWVVAKGLAPGSDLLASDSDLDGLINAMEFCLGSSPFASSTQSLPICDVLAGNLRFRFVRNLAVSTATWTVQQATTLGGPWLTAASKTNTASWIPTAGYSLVENAITGEVIVTSPAVSASQRRFMRLLVVIP